MGIYSRYADRSLASSDLRCAQCSLENKTVNKGIKRHFRKMKVVDNTRTNMSVLHFPANMFSARNQSGEEPVLLIIACV